MQWFCGGFLIQGVEIALIVFRSICVRVSYPEFLLKLMKRKWALIRPSSFPPKAEAI